jgi:hypothetical protein
MKTNRAKYFIIVAWILLSILSGCEKEAAKVNPFVPTIMTTDTITNITATSAISGGEITSEGRTPVIARGVCWSTNQNPTIADNRTTDGTGTGSFTSSITGLTTGTTYYVRAYATNSIGTSYGNGISFEINDYLPLKVGAKYKYDYVDSYAFPGENTRTVGECIWKFISMSADTTVVYHVEQSLTGYRISEYFPSFRRDSTHIESQISNLNFEVQNDGKVAFNIMVPYWGASKVTFERFIQSGKNDTCLNHGCLRKNVGITTMGVGFYGNHSGTVSYSLIEGPYY